MKKTAVQARSKQTVDCIMIAVRDLYKRGDLKQASILDISRKAGVSVGSIYQFFSSKEGVLVHFLKNELEKKIIEFSEKALHISDFKDLILLNQDLRNETNPLFDSFIVLCPVETQKELTVFDHRILNIILKMLEPKDHNKALIMFYSLSGLMYGLSSKNSFSESEKENLVGELVNSLRPELIECKRG